MGSGPVSPFGLEDKCLVGSWMFPFLEDLQTLPIPKKLQVWTQYRLLLFFQEDFEAKGDL